MEDSVMLQGEETSMANGERVNVLPNLVSLFLF